MNNLPKKERNGCVCVEKTELKLNYSMREKKLYAK